MPDNKVQKMGTLVTHPTKEIGKMQTEKEFMERLQVKVDRNLKETSQQVLQTVNIVVSQAAQGPMPLNLNKEILKAAADKLAENLQQLRELNQENRVKKVAEILEDAGAIKAPHRP